MHRHHKHRELAEHYRRTVMNAPRRVWWVHWRLRRRIFALFTFAMLISCAIGFALYHWGVRPGWALFAVVLVLWGASGGIAWRLTLPVMELARVAREIGDGDLGARMHVPPHGPELAMIALTVNEMADRIEKQIRDQRELLAAVSHEIRTPLGHLRVLVDTARGGGLPESVAQELEREVLEVDNLVDQLLASSRLDFGQLERRDLDVALEAARALERLGVDASVLDVESDGCTAWADPTLLRSALAKLVRNAVEHGGGVSKLAVRRRADVVEIEVDDEGPGFTAEDLPKVFAPFHKGRGDSGSLGLGLSLVDRIAKAHGGSARAENREPRGARVTLLLPARG